MAAFDPSDVAVLLSEPRLNPYLREADDDMDTALSLYAWNVTMAAAAFETIAHLEVMLRNAIDSALREHFKEANREMPWFFQVPPLNPDMDRSITAVRQRLRPLMQDTRHQIVAGLSFGFWSGLTGRRYDDLWRICLYKAFPHSSGNRKQVAAAVEGVRKFRNKIAHHDSLLNVDVPFELRRVVETAGLISPTAAAWLTAHDRSMTVYAQRPAASADTVVVPARDAWPFYEQSRAYVCQPNRWFRPVDRIAFYADQEVKPDVPRITERRDNVPWTEAEANRLEQSDDRDDRKIAAVIRASQAAGWTEGSYQVFLLTAPGDPRHRTLPQPVPHQTAGRGSAYVRRQRYLSLHQLETATTTADL